MRCWGAEVSTSDTPKVKNQKLTRMAFQQAICSSRQGCHPKRAQDDKPLVNPVVESDLLARTGFVWRKITALKIHDRGSDLNVAS
jgi:hypothetical protein